MHVITRLGLGGAERIAETIASHMTEAGTESIIVPVAGYRDESMATAMRQKLERHGVRVVRAGRSTNARVAALQAVPKLARIIDRWQPDIVHLHTEIPEFTWALTTLVSRRARDTAVVRTIHNTILWGGWSQAGRLAERRLSSAAVVAVSNAASDAFVAWRVDADPAVVRPPVIYNGVDEVEVDRPPRPRSVPVLCFAGRFEPQKGVDVMVEAIPMVTHPFTLMVFGSGSLSSIVTDLAEAQAGRVILSDPVPDIRDRFAEFDAILMPSRFEGLSNLAVEALFGGLPLLATDAPGLSEAMPDWYPGRCPTDDAPAFAAMVDSFLAAPSAWTTPVIEAQAWARDRFSAATMVEEYLALYTRVTQGRSRPEPSKG